MSDDDEDSRSRLLFDTMHSLSDNDGWTVTRMHDTSFVAVRQDGLVMTAALRGVSISDGRVSAASRLEGIPDAIRAHDAFAKRVAALAKRGKIYLWGLCDDGLQVQVPDGEVAYVLRYDGGVDRGDEDLPGGDRAIPAIGVPNSLMDIGECIVVDT